MYIVVHLIHESLFWSRGQYEPVLTLKSKQVPTWDIGEVLSLHTSCRIASSLVDLKLSHLLSRSIHAPLTELVVFAHAVHGGLV